MKECKHCKTQNRDDYVYCMNCGRKLSADEGNKAIQGLKGFASNKKVILAAAAIMLVLIAGIFLFGRSRSGNKEDYTLQKNRAQFIQGDNAIYIFEGSTKKVQLDDAIYHGDRYSLDEQTLLIQVGKEGEESLQIYHDGKIDVICTDFSKYTLAESGEGVFYMCDTDGSAHLYQVSKKKDQVIFADAEKASHFGQYVMSYSGSVLAYMIKEDDGTKLHVYSSSKDQVLPVDGAYTLLAVSEKGEVFYYDENDAFAVCDSRGDILISEDYYLVCSNLDCSQILATGEEEFVLYENGKISRGSFDGNGQFLDIILPENVLAQSYVKYNSGTQYEPFYHLGIADFRQLYYVTTDYSIMKLDKNLKTTVIAEDVYDYCLSSDGKTLIWSDGNSAYRYNGSQSDFNCGETGIYQFLSYDSVNKGLYFTTDSYELAYSDGKTVMILEGCNPDPDMYVCCDDGYFYFKDGSMLYAAHKGSDVTEVGETYYSGTSTRGADFFAQEGIGFEAPGGDYFFARNGKAARLDTGEGEAIT